MMTIEELKAKKLIIFECISGSRAYGLATATSDTDIKGVFILPKKEYYGLNYVAQVSDKSNDEVYYELGRFIELLSVNNPNILELLNTPSAAILHKHSFLDDIKSEMILSKLCQKTFGKFALSQIKKAKGLKKKIVNPMSKERKSILSFCFVNHEQGAVSLKKFLELKKWKQEYCGLVNIPHMNDVYGLYYDENLAFNGIIKSDESNDISLSSIPKNKRQIALLYFNKNGYSSYCKEYREYWAWVEKRNEARYKNTQKQGKGYDAKNMMHTFRLLEMAIEIGREQKINVKRPNRDFLLSIKNGAYEYQDLLKMAAEKQAEMEAAFANTSLPEKPNLAFLNGLLFRLRDRFYALEQFQ
ncbi:MAG: DNA polymerase beta superfamily protein [Chitinophagales bacterium]